MRRLAKEFLKRFERKLVYVPKGQVWGADLNEDLRTMICRNDPTCLDVGANTGQTIHRLFEIFGNPTIHAFEPSPSTFATLNALTVAHSVHLYNSGVGAAEGELPFYEYTSNDLSSFLKLSNNEQSRFAGAMPANVVSVPVTTIDRFLEDHAIGQVDLLKSDTQGYDLQVLMGAKKAIQEGRVAAVMVELNFIELYSGQAPVTEILDFMTKYGFGLVDLYEKERRKNCIDWCNALFVYKGVDRHG